MNRKAFEDKLAAQALADPEFRARLVANPVAVMTEELAKIRDGEFVPTDLKITVLEETPDQIYIVLPVDPAAIATGALSDEQLRQVAGGTSEAVATTAVVVNAVATTNVYTTAVVDGVATIVGTVVAT